MTTECHVNVLIPSRTSSSLTRCARVPSASAIHCQRSVGPNVCVCPRPLQCPVNIRLVTTGHNADGLHQSFSETHQTNLTGTCASFSERVRVDGPMH